MVAQAIPIILTRSFHNAHQWKQQLFPGELPITVSSGSVLVRCLLTDH